ncbi:hypothetical protein ACWD8I_25625, partial [Micromonospora arida]
FEGQPAAGKDFHIDWDSSAAEKGGYDWFMLKVPSLPGAARRRGRRPTTGERRPPQRHERCSGHERRGGHERWRPSDRQGHRSQQPPG